MQLRRLVMTFCLALLAVPAAAQDLAPRADVIMPKDSNALTLTWSYYNGGQDFNGAIPVKDARG